MIRHRPFGSGHPYRLEFDQRVPVRPLAGEPFELRATTDAGVRQLWVELDEAGERRLLVCERWDGVDPTAVSAASIGHLAAAAGRIPRLRGRIAWRARLEAMAEGTGLRYRFVAEREAPGAAAAADSARGDRRGRRTAWFEVEAWAWAGGSPELRIDLGGPAGASAVRERFDASSVAWLRGRTGPARVRFALRLEPDEHVVGFGERFDAFDQRGRRLDTVVFEQYKHQGSRTYLPVPFAIVAGGSRGGWGFHVASSRRAWFDVGASDPARLWVEVDLDPERGPWTLPLRLYAGDPAAVLGAFLAETAQPALPPEWVFHPWMSGNEWNTQARVLAEVERGERDGIPAGVLVIEAWSDERTFAIFRDAVYEPFAPDAPRRLADFTFPPDGAWPDPKSLVETLHAKGIRLLLWQPPFLKTLPPVGGQPRIDAQTMVERGYAIREADGRPYRNRAWWFPQALLPDFTSHEATEWWTSQRRYLVDELGIDGFKTDGGEHAWGHDLRYADGTRGDETNNRYPVLYAQAFWRLLRECGTDGIVFSRAGFTGAQAAPCHWAGDEDSTWDGFRASITAGLTAGASGVFFWGWDLAGFSGEVPSAELYLRSAAMACLCPIMQYHAEFNHHRLPSRDRTPWNIAERSGDARVIPVFRRFATLRERLVPYLAEQAARSVERGRPLMRALAFEWPDDAEAWRWSYEYLLGDELLVAPVVEEGITTSRTYLPEGAWVDAWTGERATGPAVVEAPAPLERIPVFVREAAWPGLSGCFEGLPGATR